MIDDDPIILEITTAILEGEYDVTTTASGEEALALFYGGFTPNLILLDLVMPGLSGFATFERVKAISNLHHIPTAVYTASSDPADREKAKRMGIDGFISKTVSRQELAETVKSMIRP